MEKTAEYELRLLRSRLKNARKKLLAISELRCSPAFSGASERRRIRVFDAYVRQRELADHLEGQVIAKEAEVLFSEKESRKSVMNSIDIEQLGGDFSVYQECRIYSILYRGHRIISGSKMEVTKAVDAIASFIALSKEASE